MKRSRLRNISPRRLEETTLYHYRRTQFLLAHPYCQIWLIENKISEDDAIRLQGRVTKDDAVASIPLSTQIHHKNKRRGHDLLDQEHWMAVSAEAHLRIESNKAWARAMGFLLPF